MHTQGLLLVRGSLRHGGSLWSVDQRESWFGVAHPLWAFVWPLWFLFFSSLKSLPWTPLEFFSSPRKKGPGPPPVRGPCGWPLVSFPFSLCILPSPCCLFTSFSPQWDTKRKNVSSLFGPGCRLTWGFTVPGMREDVKACAGKMLPCAIKCGFRRFFFWFCSSGVLWRRIWNPAKLML